MLSTRLLKRACFTAVCVVASAMTASAQTETPDLSKMGHFKLRSWLKDNGLKTASGRIVHVGDTLLVGKGTLPDKRFAFIYQSQTGFGSYAPGDAAAKLYLNSSATGRKAIVKSFFTAGVRKGDYTIYTVVGLGELANYWLELEGALESGEVKFLR